MKSGCFLAVFMLALVLLLPGAAGAVEFSLVIPAGAFTFRMTAGPDENFGSPSILEAASRRSLRRAWVTEYANGVSTGSAPYDITLGPDGNLRFTENSYTKRRN